MDVGYTVPVCVGASGPGKVGQVDTHTVGHRQAGPFPDEQYERLHAHRLGDVITERHPGLSGDDGRCKRVGVTELRDQSRQEWNPVIGQRTG